MKRQDVRVGETYDKDNGYVGVVQLPCVLAQTENHHELSANGDGRQGGEGGNDEPIIPPEDTAIPPRASDETAAETEECNTIKRPVDGAQVHSLIMHGVTACQVDGSFSSLLAKS